MFKFFKSKDESADVKDLIWISEEFKFRNMLTQWQANTDLVFITWFDDTNEKARKYFGDTNQAPVYEVRQVNAGVTRNKRIIFLEHHPDAGKENRFFKSIGIQKAEVWSSMDEALFAAFGADRISGLMKQLGMKDDEPIEHSMISSSIRNAQKKIAGKIKSDNHASSQGEWLAKNVL